jgi:hypothetical protein
LLRGPVVNAHADGKNQRDHKKTKHHCDIGAAIGAELSKRRQSHCGTSGNEIAGGGPLSGKSKPHKNLAEMLGYAANS